MGKTAYVYFTVAVIATYYSPVHQPSIIINRFLPPPVQNVNLMFSCYLDSRGQCKTVGVPVVVYFGQQFNIKD